jgi:hypothetical protein
MKIDSWHLARQPIDHQTRYDAAQSHSLLVPQAAMSFQQGMSLCIASAIGLHLILNNYGLVGSGWVNRMVEEFLMH